MRRRMDVGPVLDLHGLRQTFDQPPEFALYVIFRDQSSSVEYRIKGHLRGKIALFEVVRFLLELSERVDASFFETKLASADQTSRTFPVVVRGRTEGRIKTLFVVSVLAAVAQEYGCWVISFAASFALLHYH